MKWVPSRGWSEGQRWELRNCEDELPVGRVLVLNEQHAFEASLFAEWIYNDTRQTFKTMKEAAEWLIKKATSGTGAKKQDV